MLNTYWDPVMNKDQNDSSLQPLFLGVKQGEHELLTAQPWWGLQQGLCACLHLCVCLHSAV